MSDLSQLVAVRDALANLSAARTQVKKLDGWIAKISLAPPEKHGHLLSAVRVLEPRLTCLPTNNVICPAYPRAPRELQARIALGARPADVLLGLTAREAHEALSASATDPVAWLLRDVSLTSRPRSVAVARWVLACLADPMRREALERARIGRVAGEEVRGRATDRLDEIDPIDLVGGNATGVDVALDAAGRRAYARWEAEASTRHEALASPPPWWRPIRCAQLLMSAADLAREGREMRHCVGTYAHHVRNKSGVIVSIAIRARYGMHRATVYLSRSEPRVIEKHGADNASLDTLCERALAVCLNHWSAA